MNTQNASHVDLEPDLNFESALARLGGDRGLFDKMAAILREDAPKLLKAIGMGLDTRDGSSAALAAHTLKNIVATCGGERAAKVAGSLENFARHKEFERAAESFDTLGHSVGVLLQALPLSRESL